MLISPRHLTNAKAQMLSRRAVVGSHGRNPIVDRLTDRLKSHGKTVYRVNPYGKPPAEYKSLG